ncbi:MAG TPA: hypothetical protein VGL63_16925 [Streptosporangiaceae bacterium]
MFEYARSLQRFQAALSAFTAVWNYLAVVARVLGAVLPALRREIHWAVPAGTKVISAFGPRPVLAR